MSEGHDDFQSEALPGLPEALPAGEQILWQGAPQWWELATRVFHVRGVAAYFLLLMGRRAWLRLGEGGDSHAALSAFLSLLPIALLGLGLLMLLARLSARTSLYTITNRRVVLRVGIALPTAINLPFKRIAAADARLGAGDRGDIALRLVDGNRVAYSSLWPHVRPWRLRQPEPMLRGITDLHRVAGILSAALVAAMPADATLLPVPPLANPPRPSARPETLADGFPPADVQLT